MDCIYTVTDEVIYLDEEAPRGQQWSLKMYRMDGGWGSVLMTATGATVREVLRELQEHPGFEWDLLGDPELVKATRRNA